MALFNFGKKNEEERKDQTCCCCDAGKAAETVNICCGETKTEVCCVKVLGSGCKSCHALLEAAKEAVKSLGLNVEVEYVTDMEKIMAYGVMSMPALVVNERVVSMGKVLKAADVVNLLKKLGF